MCLQETKGTVTPGVPSEVEIDLGAKIAAQDASTSPMDWDEIQSDTQEVSEDDTENIKSKPKRQKLDSGIGEATPSSSSPDKSKTESDSDQSYTTTDDAASLYSECTFSNNFKLHGYFFLYIYGLSLQSYHFMVVSMR